MLISSKHKSAIVLIPMGHAFERIFLKPFKKNRSRIFPRDFRIRSRSINSLYNPIKYSRNRNRPNFVIIKALGNYFGKYRVIFQSAHRIKSFFPYNFYLTLTFFYTLNKIPCQIVNSLIHRLTLINVRARNRLLFYDQQHPFVNKTNWFVNPSCSED